MIKVITIVFDSKTRHPLDELKNTVIPDIKRVVNDNYIVEEDDEIKVYIRDRELG